MSYKTFKELPLDESRSISGNDHISSLDTYIYQGQDKLQDKDAKESEASEANPISSNRILNLCYMTDSLYPSKGDNQGLLQSYHVMSSLQNLSKSAV